MLTACVDRGEGVINLIQTSPEGKDFVKPLVTALIIVLSICVELIVVD